MLPIVGPRTAGDFRVAGVLVNIQNVAWVQGVLIGNVDDIPDIGGRRRIGKPEMVINDVVKGSGEGFRRTVIYVVVVACRGGGLGQGAASQQRGDTAPHPVHWGAPIKTVKKDNK